MTQHFLAHGDPLVVAHTQAFWHSGRPCRLVCLGDSITGVYYHTGGRRAWPELLAAALERLLPQTVVTVVNAGQSGDTTEGALRRLEPQVLAHKPDWAVIMLGMNDVVRGDLAQYVTNLRLLVTRCRVGGAKVLLCTPTAILDEGTRTPEKLAEYAAAVRQLGAELQAPVADCAAAMEQVRSRDPLAFYKLMSDAIHPNLAGHQLIAETVAAALTGQRVLPAAVPPLRSGLPHLRRRLEAGEKPRVVAMSPGDEWLRPALQAVWPGARLLIERWETAGQSLAQLEAAAQARGWLGLRDHPEQPRPDLVLIAIPASATADDLKTFWRRYTWVLNWSLSFGRAEWDVAALVPPQTARDDSPAELQAPQWALEVIRAQDLPYLELTGGDTRTETERLGQWLLRQLER